jgi:hypothetical protein
MHAKTINEFLEAVVDGTVPAIPTAIRESVQVRHAPSKRGRRPMRSVVNQETTMKTMRIRLANSALARSSVVIYTHNTINDARKASCRPASWKKYVK